MRDSARRSIGLLLVAGCALLGASPSDGASAPVINLNRSGQALTVTVDVPPGVARAPQNFTISVTLTYLSGGLPASETHHIPASAGTVIAENHGSAFLQVALSVTGSPDNTSVINATAEFQGGRR